MAKGQRDAGREAYWRKMIASWRESGLGVRPFCRRERLKETALYFWRRELQRRDVAATPSVAFVELQARGDESPAAPTQGPTVPLELVLPGQWRLLIGSGCDRQLLGEVLRALAEARPC